MWLVEVDNPQPNGGNSAPVPGSNTPVGGGAPIGSGIGFLVALAAAQAGRKWWLGKAPRE